MSAFLEGLVGGASSVQAFGQQQFENKRRLTEFDESVRQYDQSYALAQDNYKLNKRQTKINEDGNSRSNALQPGVLKKQGLDAKKQGLDIDKLALENKKTVMEQLYKDNDRFSGELTAAGFLNPELGPMGFDMPQAIKNIVEGGAVNDSLAFKMLQKDPDIPEGFTYDTIDRTNPNGLIISGTYKDGTKGVLTGDGKISNDSAVAALPPQVIARLMDDEYQTNIRGNSTLGGTDATMDFLLAQGMGQADAEEVVKRQTAQATIATAVIGELEIAADDPATGDEKNVGMVRQFKGLLASAETPEEKLQILLSQAETMGIPVPEILTNPAPVSDENSIQERLAQADITPEKWSAFSDEQKAQAVNVLNIRAGLKQVGGALALQPAAMVDLMLLGPKSVGNVGIAGANSSVGKAVGLTDVGDENIEYFDPLANSSKMLEAAKGKPSITLDQANANFTAIANQPEQIQQAAQDLEAGLFAKLDTMTPDQLVAHVDGDGFEPTADDERKLAAVLDNAGVTTAADIRKLPSAAQQNVRAWMYATAKQTGDRTAAEIIRKEMVNLGTGGTTNMTAGEAQDLTNKTRDSLSKQQTSLTGVYNAETSRGKLKLDIKKHFLATDKFNEELSGDTRERADERSTRLKTAIYGDDGEGGINDDINFNRGRLFKEVGGVGGVFPQAYAEMEKARKQKSPDYPALQAEVNGIISAGFQALAESEEYGTFFENFLPDDSIDHIGGGDKFLNRLMVTERDANKEPVRFGVKGLGSQQQIDETISATVIKDLFGASGFAYIRRQMARK